MLTYLRDFLAEFRNNWLRDLRAVLITLALGIGIIVAVVLYVGTLPAHGASPRTLTSYVATITYTSGTPRNGTIPDWQELDTDKPSVLEIQDVEFMRAGVLPHVGDQVVVDVRNGVVVYLSVNGVIVRGR